MKTTTQPIKKNKFIPELYEDYWFIGELEGKPSPMLSRWRNTPDELRDLRRGKVWRTREEAEANIKRLT